MPFPCSICGEEATRICVRCTKDACDNHLCEKCRRCSDCCECEVTLTPPVSESVRSVLHSETPAVVPVEPVAEPLAPAEPNVSAQAVGPAESAPAPEPAEPVEPGEAT